VIGHNIKNGTFLQVISPNGGEKLESQLTEKYYLVKRGVDNVKIEFSSTMEQTGRK